MKGFKLIGIFLKAYFGAPFGIRNVSYPISNISSWENFEDFCLGQVKNAKTATEPGRHLRSLIIYAI